MSFRSVLTSWVLILIPLLAGCGSSSTTTLPPEVPRPDLQTVTQTASEGSASIRNLANANGSAFAPVVLFEERHDLRAVQVQEALVMVRMHDQFGMRDIALEGYLKDGGA